MMAAMFLTAITESIILWLCRYRSWMILVYFLGLNLISNFLANSVYQYMYYTAPKIALILLIELGVYVFEVGLLGLATGYNKKLFYCVLLSNIITYSLGVVLYGF